MSLKCHTAELWLDVQTDDVQARTMLYSAWPDRMSRSSTGSPSNTSVMFSRLLRTASAEPRYLIVAHECAVSGATPEDKH